MDHAALIGLLLANVELPYSPDDLGSGERDQDVTLCIDGAPLRIDPGD